MNLKFEILYGYLAFIYQKKGMITSMRKSMMTAILLCCFVLFSTCITFAESWKPKVDFNGSTGALNVAGEVEPGALVTLLILKHGVAFDDATKVILDNDVLYSDQCLVMADGTFAFEIEFEGVSGTYHASIADSKKEERYAFTIPMVDPSAYPAAIEAINTASAGDFETVFKPAFVNNRDNLGFHYSIGESDETLKLMQAQIREQNLLTDEYEKNLKLYQTFCIIDGLNRNIISDINTHLEDIYFADSTLKNDFINVGKISGATIDATRKMSGKSISGLNDFFHKFAIGMVLAGVRYTNGIDSVMSLISKYQTVLGITKPITQAATMSVNGEDYGTAMELAVAYHSYTSPQSSSGGGTRVPDTSLGGTSVGLSPLEEDSQKDKEVVTVSYHDIEGYEWAVPAILALSDKGIVNGKGDGKFAPEDNVLREEFAKILVGALSENPAKENIFDDVPADAWYLGWVNRAAELGICQGIGNNEFGVGNFITREDMCVMLVRALRYKNFVEGGELLPFEDQESISEYAKESVSVLYKMGAIQGVTETKFEPKSLANRAQAAKMIYYVLDRLQ